MRSVFDPFTTDRLRGRHHAWARSEQLKPSFNKSGQNSAFSAEKALPTRPRPRAKTDGPRHGNHCVRIPFLRRRTAAITESGVLGEFRSASGASSSSRAFDPYRPELHYMRGPGPACRAKQRRGVTCGPVDGRRNPGRKGTQVAARSYAALLRPGRFFRPRALARAPLRATMKPPGRRISAPSPSP